MTLWLDWCRCRVDFPTIITYLQPVQNSSSTNHLSYARLEMSYSSYSSFLNTLTTTTSKYTSNLKRTLLNSEADGDTEDDTHISRVLRAYYTEKGRQFPEWLPPDPKAPPPPQIVQSSYGQQQGGFVSSYGQPNAQQQPLSGGGRFGRGGGLSDLWDAPGRQQQAPEEPASLRARPGMRPAGNSSTSIERADSGRSGQGRFGGGGDGYDNAARPLPSQRAGSYQSQFAKRPSEGEISPPPGSGGSTASDRLKQRLWGTGRASPTATQQGGGMPAPASTGNPYSSAPSPRNPYDSTPAPSRQAPAESRRPAWSGGGGGGDGGASYSASGGGDPYGTASSGRAGGYSGGYNNNASYSSGDTSGGGGGNNAGGGGGGYGLPSGPKGGQRPMGLPSGPRLKR